MLHLFPVDTYWQCHCRLLFDVVKLFKQADDEFPKTSDSTIMYVILYPEGGRVPILHGWRGGSLQMMTVLYREGGSSQMFTVLDRGGLANDYDIP